MDDEPRFFSALDLDGVRVRVTAFAVIEVAMKYVLACYFDDVVTVHLRLGTRTKATFQIEYLLTVGAETRVTAVTAHGCVDGQGRAMRLPAWLAAL